MGRFFRMLFISKGQIAEDHRQALERMLLIYVEDLDPESIQAKNNDLDKHDEFIVF